MHSMTLQREYQQRLVSTMVSWAVPEAHPIVQGFWEDQETDRFLGSAGSIPTWPGAIGAALRTGPRPHGFMTLGVWETPFRLALKGSQKDDPCSLLWRFPNFKTNLTHKLYAHGGSCCEVSFLTVMFGGILPNAALEEA